MTQFNPPHPGEILGEFWLKPLVLSISKAAEVLKVSRKTLSEIVNGRAAVSAEMALRLELAFGKSAESWLGHQSAYDLRQLQGKRKQLGCSLGCSGTFCTGSIAAEARSDHWLFL